MFSPKLKDEYKYSGAGGYRLSRLDITDGYFTELSLEYKYSAFAPQFELGLFARYSALQALTEDPIEISTYGYQGVANKIGYRRDAWTLGGSLAARFSSAD